MPLEIIAKALGRITQGMSSPTSPSSSSSSSNPSHFLRHATNIATNIPTYPTSTPTSDTMSFQDSRLDSVGPSVNNQPGADRPHYGGVITADILSMSGSLAIILMVPKVIVQVPSQKKRMILILLTAISNLGFSTSNIATGA